MGSSGTINALEPKAVASVANILRGTSLFSQGIAAVSKDIDPVFPEISITPFKIPPLHKPIQLPWTNRDSYKVSYAAGRQLPRHTSNGG